MKRIMLALVCLSVIMSGCTARQIKDNARRKHVESYVFVERLNDPNVSKRPTQEEKDVFIKASAKDYESYDIYFNHWKPTPGTMKKVDVDGNRVD